MIHLDANATSRLRPSALLAVEEFLRREVGNASSIHDSGRQARTILTRARSEVARFFLNSERADVQIFFTSGGTESCNALIHGFFQAPSSVLVSEIEHSAILEPIENLRNLGTEVVKISSTREGYLEPSAFVNALRQDTALVAVMLANNETGAIQPVREIAQALRASGYSGAIVSDISQAVGKSEFSLEELFRAGVNAVAISGHKLGALPGIGAVILAGGSYGVCFQFSPLILGGAQEQGLRSGTENLLGISSLAAALKDLKSNGVEERSKISALRDELWSKLNSSITSIEKLTPQSSLSNTLLVRFVDCRGDDLVVSLDLLGIAVSRGSACNSGKQKASHVTRAMGLSELEGSEVIRLSLDWDVTSEDIAAAAEKIILAVNRMRAEARAA